VPTVSVDSTPTCLADIWSDLTGKGYAITSDEALGLPEKFRTNFAQTYFNDHVLEEDPGGKPPGRKRARDVIRYWWHGDDLHLQEHDKITIIDRDGIPGEREHARVMLLDDPEGKELVRALLRLVPPEQRQADGTFGVNLFRTFTDVVTTPHHDQEQFCLVYVLDRVGGGAETYLYNPDDVTEEGEPIADPILRHQLNPGEVIIFEDKRFKHGATPLEAPPGETARRDAVVCTIDRPGTYLDAKSVS
jgi:2OG-Fe dioxygenase